MPRLCNLRCEALAAWFDTWLSPPAPPTRFWPLAPPTINPQFRSLVLLGLDQNLFTREHAHAVQAALGPETSLMDFAQSLIDDGHVDDAELAELEQIAGIALRKGLVGPPADDPFAVVATAASTPANPVLCLDKSTLAPAVAPPEPAAPPSGTAALPSLAWDQIGTMATPALAAALSELLRDCIRFGTSDLHLSAGMMPIISRNRVLVTLRSHRLAADEALRLNLALLTPEQNTLYQKSRDFD